MVAAGKFNVPHNPKYIKSIATGEFPFEREILDITSRTNEFILTSLRTKMGLRSDYIKTKIWI
jgi:oxygen-independent coproporphyrinogen-3 oxidase